MVPALASGETLEVPKSFTKRSRSACSRRPRPRELLQETTNHRLTNSNQDGFAAKTAGTAVSSTRTNEEESITALIAAAIWMCRNPGARVRLRHVKPLPLRRQLAHLLRRLEAFAEGLERHHATAETGSIKRSICRTGW